MNSLFMSSFSYCRMCRHAKIQRVLMLERGRELRSCFDQYCTDNDYAKFKISDIEWWQMDFLLQLTKPL